MADLDPSFSSQITLDVPSLGGGENVVVALDDIYALSNEQEYNVQLQDVTGLLAQEHANVKLWVRLVEETWAQGRWRSAFEIADQGLRALHDTNRFIDQVPLHLLKATYHLSLARRAPKLLLPTNLTGPIALPKDPHHPEFPKYGNAPGMPGPMTKDEYWKRAEYDIGQAERLDPQSRIVRDVKASWCMARGRLDEASKLFERILAEEPTHLMALMGRARIQFSSRSFRPALKTYQQVLRLKPDFLPDPRIGIGLCFWMLGDREKARKAWERSAAVNPSSPSPSAPLLLGLLHLNASRDPLLPGGEPARAAAYEVGFKHIQQAFKKDNTSAGAAAMGCIAGHLGMQVGGRENALKLSERMLAFADSRLLVAEAHLARARAIDSAGAEQHQMNGEVLASYQKAQEANPDEVMAGLGVGSCFVRMEQFPHAINAYETLLRRHPKCVEALAALASIHTHLAFTFHSISDSSTARKSAKDSYSAVLRIFSAGTTGTGGGADLRVSKSERVRVLARDRDLYVEVARLWSDEGGVERSLQAWEKAMGIEEDAAEEEEEKEEEEGEDEEDLYEAPKEENGEEGEKSKKKKKEKKDPVDPRIRNNLGVQHFNRRPLPTLTSASSSSSQPSQSTSSEHLHLAAEQFELALSGLLSRRDEVGGQESDAQLTVFTFNLGAAYEAMGEREKAREAWERVLSGHPEFVEAKARLALLLMKSRRSSDLDAAHILLKEALTSSPSSADLRALYTYFLLETGQPKLAREFARSTLKEVSRHDLYALCASGALYYHEARENKGTSKEAVRDRQGKYTRAVEFFDKALQLSPQCAFAAQGIAIALAEGALGSGPLLDAAASSGLSGAGGAAAQPLTETQARLRNARDALTILTKIKESVNEASVYVNIGHCHFARDEYEKAIENYEMASKRYLHDKSSTVLWYLARSWYHMALRQSSYANLQKAIEVGEKATALNPKDLANVFNMAVLKQKGFEMLEKLPNEKRRADELRSSLEHLQASQTLFEQLVANQSSQPPYPKDIVKARLSYGSSLSRRFDEILQRQLDYEQTEQGKLDQARRVREAEQQKREEAEKERIEQVRRQAEALAEQRRKMREEAETWGSLSNAWAEDDEEDGKKKKRGGGGGGGGKKRKTKDVEEGEETPSEGEEKPKKKKKAAKEKKPKKSKKAAAVQDDEDGEGGGKMDVDEQYDVDDEDAPIQAQPKRKGRVGKNVKSAEFIESSDDDDE
ncbi:hypothetical protein JCM8547_002055 [Rhodosporidiobolus lusitaniae]